MTMIATPPLRGFRFSRRWLKLALRCRFAFDGGCNPLLLTLGCCVAALVACAPLPAAEKELTFFGWSDQHVAVDGGAEHVRRAVDAMNDLPGEPYPSVIGGKVAVPSFVLGCGDITEWPTHAAISAYDELLTKRLKYAAYDVMGNHDEGGKVPSETAKNWLRKRHETLTYAFDTGGVRFVMLYCPYDESLNNPVQPLTADSLNTLRRKLEECPAEKPTIVATHLCFDAIANRDDLLDTLEGFNILAILGGHYHKSKVDRAGGRVFIQLPSPAPGSPSEIMVVRIKSNRLMAIPFDYEHQRWVTDSRKMLDTRVELDATRD
jgi:hypothetical protein